MFGYRAHAGEREAARLEGEIAEVCGLLNATTGKLVGLIAEALATESWTGWGIRSAEHWVAWQCGVSASRAHKLVIMARRLNDLPQARAAFDAGELSEDQVAVIVRHTPVHNDTDVTEFARSATVTQLQRTLRSYPFTAPAEPGPEPAEPQCSSDERREVSFGYTDNGRWRLFADLPGDRGALIERSLAAQRDRLFHDGEPDQRITWADALETMADRAATATGSEGRHHRDRSLVLVHLNSGRGQPGPRGSPIAHLHDGPALPDTLRRYLCCDTRIRPVWETDGVAISVGRAVRTVPQRTRVTVEERDRGCRTPGCPRTRWLHVHHIVHWEDGGPTDTANLVCLCPYHHRSHHRGALGITGNADSPHDDPDALVFTDQRGRPLKPNAPPDPPAHPHDAAAPRLGVRPTTYHHPIGEPLDTWSIAFTNHPRPEQAAVDAPPERVLSAVSERPRHDSNMRHTV